MDIEKNTTYTCRVVRINGEEVDYLAALVVDDECITRITIKEVERKDYDKVRNEACRVVFVDKYGIRWGIMTEQTER